MVTHVPLVFQFKGSRAPFCCTFVASSFQYIVLNVRGLCSDNKTKQVWEQNTRLRWKGDNWTLVLTQTNAPSKNTFYKSVQQLSFCGSM